MIKNVLILGGGSAGFITAITLKKRIPQLQVKVLRSPEIGIIGVGEGSTPALTIHLHGYLEIDPGEFYREATPSWKLGIRFLWGPREHFNYSFNRQFDTQFNVLKYVTGYYCEDDVRYADIASSLMDHDKVSVRVENGGPYIGSDLAYHLENETFVAYLEKVAVRLGVEIEDGTVENVERNGDHVSALVSNSGQRYEADLFVDSSGFRSYLLGQTLGEPFIPFKESLYCNRAVVGGWAREDEVIKPYTTAETMDSGWCWQIEHEHRINRGYVYSSDFISDAAAEEEFRRKNPKITKTRVVPYVSGRRARAWVGNVVAVGNACGFVEPLESTALGVICGDAQGITESLIDSGMQIRPTVVTQYNKRAADLWTVIRDFLALHYKFNTRLNTPFWQAARNDIPLHDAQPVVDFYRENGPTPIWRKTLLKQGDIFDMEGYLAMLVGMQVPYQYRPEITEEDRKSRRRIQDAFRQKAEAGLTVAETLAIVRSPNWSWSLDFYKEMYQAAKR
jgi:tryptophan halogenase